MTNRGYTVGGGNAHSKVYLGRGRRYKCFDLGRFIRIQNNTVTWSGLNLKSGLKRGPREIKGTIG